MKITKYFTITPILRDTGRQAAQMPDVRYCEYSHTLIAPYRLIATLHDTPKPSTPDAAYLAMWQAIEGWQGQAKLTTQLTITAAGRAVKSASQKTPPPFVVAQHLARLKAKSTLCQPGLKPDLAGMFLDFASSVLCLFWLLIRLGKRKAKITGKSHDIFYQ